MIYTTRNQGTLLFGQFYYVPLQIAWDKIWMVILLSVIFAAGFFIIDSKYNLDLVIID
jgi:hypothetical protein